MSLPYTQDISNALDVIRAADVGHFHDFRDQAEQAFDSLQYQDIPLLHLPEKTNDLSQIEETASFIRSHAEHLIVLGTGGSSLGAKTLTAIGNHPFPITFIENIDPHTVKHVLSTLNLSKTVFLAVSKSGTTMETLATTLICIEHVRKFLGNDALSRHFYIITQPDDNPLRRLAERWKLTVLDHDPDIGGRFSVLSIVGLLPACVAKLNPEALRKGAAAVLEDPHAAIEGAALAFALMEANFSNTVLIPYIDRLELLSHWFCQLWAESLGKDGRGTLPVSALGTVDQHSQLQLYLDGPRDKSFTFITVKNKGTGPKIDTSITGDARLSYLNDISLGDLMDAEQQATMETLAEAHRPVRHIRLTAVNEQSVGALLMHFMLETILTAELLRVDAFTQPAVEAGKLRARELLKKR